MRFIQLLIISLTLFIVAAFALIYFIPSKKHELISLFPLKNYDQTVTHWIKSTDSDYDQVLLTQEQQKIRKQELYAKYFGDRSPWSKEYIQTIYSVLTPEGLQSAEQEKIIAFTNANKSADNIQYGSNFIPHTQQWIQKIENNMNVKQFAGFHYETRLRGITIENLQGRVLPTNEVSFYDHKIAGEGYPFDNLQAARVWAGTPVYILGVSIDHSWSLVHTPNFVAWVKSNGLASTDNAFVKQWQQQAQKNLAAITHTQISIIDTENKSFSFTAYIGMLFPAISNPAGILISIPVIDANHQAKIHHAQLTLKQTALMPLSATPHHFANIISQLINRPYGWGGMYNHNDCSSELKNLFIPFGILLPSHSTNQVDPESYLIKKVDLSNLNIDERLAYLAKHGHRFMTIVYVGGHVFLYVGNYDNPKNPKEKIILSYQNLWGLRPNNANTRVVIGKSALFPIMKEYPENPELQSQADKTYFQLGYLDVLAKDVQQTAKTNLHEYVSP